MSKRVQFAHSYPVLTSSPVAETGRTVIFSKTDGLYARLTGGTVVGPFGAGGGGSGAVFQNEPPASPQLNDIWYDTDEAGVSVAASLVPIPFHVSGALTTGVKKPKYLAPANMTLRGAQAVLDSGSGATYRLVWTTAAGVATALATSGAVGSTATVSFDFADQNISTGDRVAIEVVSTGTGAGDLSVTVDAVTR